ncbi:AraC family transcriptional regulator [Nguyenibacter sp. L1]|uniref:AraC family transcriptional regulator n=1 Tax=Nguyenibacter sp. L1 TaxID=3049350 RepID=UPI002B488E25|nr:AraC family transcriptional regulator [Nguyenibacter sp. L1]WRH89599.1 AraC family transcriptional regulator [Nguyenibacter sp. L1]
MDELSRLRDAVGTCFACHGNASPLYTAIDGLILLRSAAERNPAHILHKPALCIVVQGAKWTSFGALRLEYRTGQAMVVSVEMPGASQVVEGGEGAPYLSVVIELDRAIMREVFERMEAPPVPDDRAGAFVLELDDALVGCAARAVGLLREPQAIPILYPAVMREICYRLLAGPHGAVLSRLVVGVDRDRRLVEAIHALREKFDRVLRVDDLAAAAGLSPTAFHRQFKALTAMTPMQFQKQIRLMEARRLLLSGGMSAEAAAFAVGYASPSQFSREYRRMFGLPPARDALRLSDPPGAAA